MNNTETPTPRTDAELATYQVVSGASVSPSFARHLERELSTPQSHHAEDLAQIAGLREAIEKLPHDSRCHLRKTDRPFSSPAREVWDAKPCDCFKQILSKPFPPVIKLEDLEGVREALAAITRRVPIMGSTGDYRDGQLHTLKACREVAKQALATLNSATNQKENT